MPWLAIFFGICFGAGAGKLGAHYYGAQVGDAITMMAVPCAIMLSYCLIRFIEMMFSSNED